MDPNFVANLAKMDHRHLAIWHWTRGHSLTDNSETSIESSFSESSDLCRMTEHTPRNMTPCTPSTSTSFSSFDLSPQTMPLLSLPAHLLRQPPPYTPRAHPPHEALFRMHNTPPVILEPECDIDVVGLSDSTNQVSLNDREEPQEEDDQPLDLSIRKSPVPSCSPSRPSVIMESHTRNPAIRRSVSNASSPKPPPPDVSEHFRRSLSGKWPRRQKTEEQKGRASPFRRHTSFNSHSSTPFSCTVIKSSGTDIEDHFRRALGGVEFEAWKRKREQEENGVQIAAE